ncbi:MAG: hypothetical protein SWJ54_00655 [Cyanobacteriota bacterium]|nr:hypothetical protein [Cyanobacteriota bacterium]
MTTPPFNQPAHFSTAGEAELSGTTPVTTEEEAPSQQAEKSKNRRTVKLPKGFWGWQLLWLTVLFGFGTMGAGALLWLLITPPPPNCQEISPLSADADRLYCADQAAQVGELTEIQAAFNLVESWPTTHPLRPRTRRMMEEWTKQLIVLADRKIDEGNLQGAMELVSIVPETSPAYSKVEDAIAGWNNDWAKGQQLYNKAVTALRKQDWAQAFSNIQELAKLNNAHWREKRFNELVDRMSIERQGFNRLKEARNMAKQDTASGLEEAIILANKISPKLYIHKVARQEIRNWSQKLIDQAKQELKAKNRNNVINIAKRVPEHSPLHKQAQDLLLLAEIQDVSLNQANSKPFLQKLVLLLEGQAALDEKSIDPALYQEAHIKTEQLEGQIQDLVALQLGKSIANVGHPFALKLAIDQAHTVRPDRPRRLHGQTLVAHWRKEIQRIEDRPHIVLARMLAEQEDLDGFRSAVKQASQVSLGRPLRIEAQTLIAEWTKRVQIIEDQPLLTEALALAEEGDLSAAIDKASEIGKGRALYAEARDNISEWVTTIQIAEDRPVLDKAYSLASKGSLSSAISQASKIRYGRALYYEAQNAIARWVEQRDAYWAAQREKSAPSTSNSSSSSSTSQQTGYSSYSSGSSSYSSGYSGGYSSYSGSYSSSSSSGYSGSYSGYSGGYSSSGYSSGSSSYSSGYSGGYSSYSGGYSSGSSGGYSSSGSSSSSSYSAPAPSSSGGSYSPPDANLFLE